MLAPPLNPRPLVRILFVDDDKNVLDGLRRVMHSMRSEWSMAFALGGAEALVMMNQTAPDIVVSDMRMPGMNGGELLGEVKRLYPQAIRFILSGYAESRSVMNVASTAHQYLSKPCESAVLKAAVARTVALRNLLHDEKLHKRIGSVDSLPSLPSVYQHIVTCLQGPDPELAEVARIISSDVVMTTMVLKLANSAFFGAKQTFKTAERAVSFLGLDTIAGLVLTHSIFNDFAVAEKSGLSLEQLWQHSVQTATGARAIARYEKWPPDRVEEAFLAGLVHDLGKLVLATRPAAFAADDVATADASARWEENHAEVGAYLLGLWGFSDTLVEAIAFHHTPTKAKTAQLELAGLLHVADRLAHLAAEEDGPLCEDGLEAGYLESIGSSGRLADWRAACATAVT